MFHCSVGGNYIVLQQDEARSLFAELSGNSGSALMYNVKDPSGSGRRVARNERAIIRWLEMMHAEDPESFRRSYVFRSAWGVEAVPALLALLDGHRRLFSYTDCHEIDRWTSFSADAQLLPEYAVPESLSVLLLRPTGLFRRKRRVIATLEIPTWDIEHVFGTVHEFVVMTRFTKLRFSRDGLASERRVRRRNLPPA